VFPGGSAEEFGIRPRDIITRVEETVITDGRRLREVLGRFRAGDRVSIELVRDGQAQELEMQLGDTGRNPRARLQNRLGGTTISRRALDFPAVIHHDTVLPASDMGGPILDLSGRIVGINIARAGRVETYALPAKVVRELLPRLTSGQMPTDPKAAIEEEGEAPMPQPLRP
jgi:serine protease Do